MSQSHLHSRPSPAVPDARAHERGNVLLLTLLALVLLAAICYALIIPAGEVTTDQERDLVSAAQITQYPAMLRTAVRRMMIQGVAAEELDFSVTAPAQGGVFSAQGGQAPLASAEDTAGAHSQWRFKGAPVAAGGGHTGWFIAGLGTDGADGKDVFAFLDGLTLPVCTQILRALGLPEEPLVEENAIDFSGAAEGTPQQTGGAGAGDTIGTASDAHVFSAWNGLEKPQPYACVRNGKDGSYIYYHILVDR